MTGTVAYEQGISTVPERAYGHSRTEDGFTLTDQSLTSSVLGDGGIYSSITDLLKWDQALYSNQLVSERSLEQAFRSHVGTDEGTGYGYGWFVDTVEHNRKMVWHWGSTVGFRTAILRIPQMQLTVIVLANRSDLDVRGYAREIMDWAVRELS
jgi:CubicO group peptidase (beta-lactamase class C family)